MKRLIKFGLKFIILFIITSFINGLGGIEKIDHIILFTSVFISIGLFYLFIKFTFRYIDSFVETTIRSD